VDVGGRIPTVGPPITRRPVPGARPVGAPVGPTYKPTVNEIPGGGIDLTDGEDPWTRYTRELDARERAAYERAAADRQARAQALMESMTGFGKALQGNAADQWGRIIESYGRAGDTATAFGNAAATSYGAGLTEANRQIAADFAAIHQGGDPTTLRDDQAALEQIRTQGGARPGETMGLVGRAWGSYGETRPGSIGFMTGQNISQVARQALEADEDAQVALIKDLADNPQQAVGMWQAMQAYKDSRTDAEAKAAQQEFENHLAQTREAREQSAWLETLAKTRTDQTGVLHVVRNGKVVPTKQYAPGSAAGRAAQQAATTRRGQTLSAQAQAASLAERQAHNRVMEGQGNARLGLSEEQVKIAQQREARLGRSAKNGGYTDAAKRQYGKTAATAAARAWSGVRNPKFDPKRAPDPVTNPLYTTPPMAAADVMRALLSAQIPYSIAWQAIYQYASRANSRWADALGWNPKYKPPSQRKR
jgi:hypothetical protein